MSCRNYLGKPKWIYGRVSKRLGKILKIGENAGNRQSNEEEEYYSPPEKQLESLDKNIPLIYL